MAAVETNEATNKSKREAVTGEPASLSIAAAGTFANFVAHATAELHPQSSPRTSSPIRAATSPTDIRRVPLRQLSLQLADRITARVTTKSAVQPYKRIRSDGEGTVVSALLCDDSYRARVVAFDAFVPQINQLVVGKIYTFKGLEVRTIPKVAVVSPDQLQLHFTAHTTWSEEADPQFDDFPDIHAAPVDFTDLHQFSGTVQTADIFGILLTVGAIQTMRSSKSGLTFTKQVVGLGNHQGDAVQVVLWGANIASCTADMLHHVYAVTDIVVKASENAKFSLASGRLTEVVDITDAEWGRGRTLLNFVTSTAFATQSWTYLTADSHFQTATNLKVLAVLDAAARDRRARPYYDTLVEVLSFKTAPRAYKMCPTPGCKRSLAAEQCRLDDDKFKCLGCAGICSSAQLGVGYCAEVQISDATYRGHALLFNESVATLVGSDLATFKTRQEANSPAYYKAMRASLYKWFLMRIGFGNDRCMVVNALRPVDDDEAVRLSSELIVKNEEGITRIQEEKID